MRNDNSLATILLASRLLDDAVNPFKAAELWDLRDQVAEPQFLLGQTEEDLIQMGILRDAAARIVELLDRATAMAFELERLDGTGIRVLTPFDEEYPQTWLDRLNRKAPPVLYTAGVVDLLNQSCIGVVGSRDVSSKGKEVAQEVAERVASLGMTLASGGARGVDQLSMNATFQAGGSVVGILAESLAHKIKKSDVRQAIFEGQTVMCTPYNPNSPFSIGNAMGRNKLIYALSELTLIVACEPNKGGTWSGAVEALKGNFGRVAVWQGPGSGTGNDQLAEMGAIPVLSIDELESAILEPEESDAIIKPGTTIPKEQLLPFESVA